MSKSAVQKKQSAKFSYTDVLKNLFPWKGDSVKEIIRKTVFLIAVTVFGVCAFLIFEYFYENFKNNQQQIENIFEYRKDLEHRLMALPKDTRQEVEEKRQELSGVEQRVTQYQKEIEEMKKQLKHHIYM